MSAGAKIRTYVHNRVAEVRIVGSYVRAIPDWIDWRRAGAWRERNHKMPSQRLRVAFVTNAVRGRQINLGYAAQLCGHEISVVTSSPASVSSGNGPFTQVVTSKNVWQTLSTLRCWKPHLIHLFVGYNNALVLPLLCNVPVPVIYDSYDCVAGMFGADFKPIKWEIYAEREFFARSDGLVSRNLEPRYIRRHLGYRIPPALYFPEYCLNEPATVKDLDLDADGDLHIAYCGGVYPEGKIGAVDFKDLQFLAVGRALAQQRIHLHLYPTPTSANSEFERYYATYYEESLRNPFFHIHRPVPYSELVSVLRQYDAGIHVLGTGVSSEIGRLSWAALNYSSAQKLFDYVEAGLPVLMHLGFHQYRQMKHYGLGIGIRDITEARQALTEFFRDKRNKVRSEWAWLNRHAGRLGAMYERTLETYNNERRQSS